MENILEIKDVTKRYPGVVALNHVSFEVAKGEVHALVGENGAGKSTMIKTITGAITPDEGKVIYEGKEYTELNPILSSQIGIEAIYQEFNLAPELTVQENIYMGTKVNQSIFIDRKELAERTKKILKELNTNIDPNVRIKDLTVAYMQLVEIAKALAKNVKLLIMDEPTRGIDVGAKHEIYEIMNDLAAQGKSIIMVSSEMAELLGMSDRVYVMCDGKMRGEIKDKKDMTQAKVMSYATQF